MMNSYRKAHYTLRHRMIATLSQRLDGITYTQRHGLIRGMKRQGGLGFLPAILAGGDHETAEHRFLRSLDLTHKTVYEVGAFQGILTLFFSSRAKDVIAYEPNPPSYNRVMQNLRLNGRDNVRVRNLAVGETPGSITLLSDPLMPGGTSGDPTVAGQIKGSSTATAVQVPVVTLDQDIAAAQLPPPELIKIDIEGMELPALKGMAGTLRRHHPDLYMEMHGATMAHKDANVRAIVEFVLSLGYTEILHVESGERITAANVTRAREGHLFCRR
jgi:FkbM family methyltransferase